MIRTSMLALATIVSADAAVAQSGEPATETAIFAAGCFWCTEEAFDKVDGVVETVSGYTGGTVESPTYRQVTAGDTGHYEALQVTYDPSKVTYDGLLDVFWRNVDPFAANGQFCDIGPSYRSAIFVGEESERQAAEASKGEVASQFDQPVATAILEEATFWPAEDYHQDYYNVNPTRYKFYKWNCGRAQRLEELWGPPVAS